MFLPVGDSPNPPGIPWVNYTLIAANVVVFLMLLPLSGQAPDVGDPALLEYLTAIAQERSLGAREVRQVAASISQYDLLVFRHGFRPSAPEVGDVLSKSRKKIYFSG